MRTQRLRCERGWAVRCVTNGGLSSTVRRWWLLTCTRPLQTHPLALPTRKKLSEAGVRRDQVQLLHHPYEPYEPPPPPIKATKGVSALRQRKDGSQNDTPPQLGPTEGYNMAGTQKIHNSADPRIVDPNQPPYIAYANHKPAFAHTEVYLLVLLCVCVCCISLLQLC